METIKVLLVDDDKDEQQLFRTTVTRINEEKKEQSEIQFDIAGSMSDAERVIDGTFDGVILDLKLGNDKDEGNEIVRQLSTSQIRVPVIFVTGYPTMVEHYPLVVKVVPRGDETYETQIDLLAAIKRTGLTHIMGRRGVIEDALNRVFLQNLLPKISPWIEYGSANPKRTEKALLRHTLNHLLQLLDNDEDKSYPEEFYITPPIREGHRTGSIVKSKSDNKYFVVLTPECDLVIRPNKGYKTDRIMLAAIEGDELIKKIKGIQHSRNEKERKKIEASKDHNPESEAYRHIIDAHKSAIEICVAQLFTNNYDLYHHWLPTTADFQGGFLNFRKLTSIEKAALDEQFGQPEIQIASPFVKDIIARFSVFIGRQGQPDIDFESALRDLLDSK